MNGQSMYEKQKLKNRFRELATLAGFTIAVGILSVATMDVLVYPLTTAAVRNPRTYTLIIKILALALPLLAGVIYLAKKISSLRKDGFSTGRIIRMIMFRPLYHITIGLAIIMFTVLIITAVYFLLNYNYYLLYRFSL